MWRCILSTNASSLSESISPINTIDKSKLLSVKSKQTAAIALRQRSTTFNILCIIFLCFYEVFAAVSRETIVTDFWVMRAFIYVSLWFALIESRRRWTSNSICRFEISMKTTETNIATRNCAPIKSLTPEPRFYPCGFTLLFQLCGDKRSTSSAFIRQVCFPCEI